MNLQTKMPTTADEFLRWNEGREGKSEFVEGRVVELMFNVTRNHVRLATRLLLQLGEKLSTSRYDIGTADVGVKTLDGVRFADVFVEKTGPGKKGSDLAATEPVLLAEILSASSYSRDFGEKVSDYTALPSLLHYLVLSQDEPRLWLWSRTPVGWSGPLHISGTGQLLDLTGLGVSMDLEKLYAGIADPSAL